MIGTLRFASLSSHRKLPLYPRDDLESLAYTLVALSTSQGLPWSPIDDIDDVKWKKKHMSEQEICNGAPKAV